MIPNKEIREVYILQIQEWFKDSVLHNREPINQLLKAIKEGDADTVEKDLTKILVNTISIFDTKSRKEEKESFEHYSELSFITKNYKLYPAIYPSYIAFNPLRTCFASPMT